MLRRSGVLLLLIFLLGCSSREILPKRTGHEYVPLRTGAWWQYAVTETTISAINGQTNALYDLRVDVIDSVDESTYILQRKTRQQGATDWEAAETWSARVTDFQYILQEGNVPFVRMQFPLVEGKSWNGNALNALGGADLCSDGSYACDNYSAVGLRSPFELPGALGYDDTVTIVENDEDDPIVGKDLRQSVYAKDIGMIYREEIHLEYCTVGTCIGEQVVENGTIVRQSLTSYGVE